MTKQELELFYKRVDEFIEHTNKNFGQVFKDRENDHKLMEEIYKAVGNSTSEAKLLVSRIEEAKDAVKDESKEAKKTMVKVGQQIEENLEGKRVITKVVPFSFMNWLRNTFWR